ncbi:MAG: HAD family hydrolase [Alphaproteobacteria bacterium]|nr:HAD family hydrolase [Alphaproteobacteria bacterium]TAD89086.1 MAG: HAD family hydrolase [Alphaproteobacteria bacterium]
MRPGLLLDRDGVLNDDTGYVGTVDRFVWRPGALDTLRRARRLGLAVAVVTNQAGIARGFYTWEAFATLTRWMMTEAARAGGPIAAVYASPYHPEGLPPWNQPSPLRKPAPGMLLAAAVDLSLDLARSVMIGDQPTDIAAARAAGVGRAIRIADQPDPLADATLLDLTGVTDDLLISL